MFFSFIIGKSIFILFLLLAIQLIEASSEGDERIDHLVVNDVTIEDVFIEGQLIPIIVGSANLFKVINTLVIRVIQVKLDLRVAKTLDLRSARIPNRNRSSKDNLTIDD